MKNQIKKSLSLFLAVLMVLSCWVWVAPQKAEAVKNEDASVVTPSDKYTVKLGYSLTNDSEQTDSYVEYKIWYVPNNCTGTASTTYVTVTDDYNLSKGTENEYWYKSVDIDGFPYYIECATYRSNTGTSGQHTIVWDYLTVGISDNMLGGSLKYTISQRAAYNWTKSRCFLLNGYTAPSNKSSSIESTTTVTWAKPAIVGFDTSSRDDIALTINKIGGDDVSASVPESSFGSYFDQYGVKWTGTDPGVSGLTAGTPYISTGSSGEAIEGDVADDIYYDAKAGKVGVKANLQVSKPSTEGNSVWYLVQKYTGTDVTGTTVTSFVSSKITVTYPEYTVTFNGGGSVSGIDYKLYYKEGDDTKTATATFSEKGPYSYGLTKLPTGVAEALDADGNDAYTFKGLWTAPQPTTGNASFNAYEADFVTPISKAEFDEYKEDGGVVDGDYITYNGVLYYNAGTQWSTSNKSITGDTTYYGWWLSKDITVKFYDIDGTYLDKNTVKYGQTQGAITWPTPTQSYTSGAFEYKNFNGTWVDLNGDTVSENGYTFTKDLILTPKYDTVSFNDKYTVNFINESNGSSISQNEYAYRTNLTAVEGAIPADRDVPTGIAKDLQYSYTFEGWSVQKPSSGNYHILLEDADFDTSGTAIAVKTPESDWIVRSDATYYPVYRRHLRTYAVNFWFNDSTGAIVSRKVTLKYGETLTAPTDYIPYTYAQEGYGYTFKNWVYFDAEGEEATFGYSNSIVFTKENIAFTLNAVEDGSENVKPVGIQAEYGDPVSTPYTVTFKYKNDKGEDQTRTVEVRHGSDITSDVVNTLAPADEYDDGEAMVHFTGDWKVMDGAAGKTEYTTEELASFSPTSHITFEAVYGNPQPFYTVTYIDGSNKFSERILVGSNLPVWTIKVTNDNETPDNTEDDTVDDVEYLPAMADTAQGYYTFQGWFDEQQADATYAETNGNKYDATSIVEGNLTLYPQFKFSPYTYTIKFMDYEGKDVLKEGTFEYGQSITTLVAEAEAEAEKREGDKTYTYTFLGWDKTVPTFCEGKDMTFIAQYKPVYKYYNAKWYNSVLDADGNWVADKSTATENDKTVETALLATTKHTYNSKVYTPSIDEFACTVTPPEGQSYVFAGWYYNDAEGNAHPYVRGQQYITADMEFYATYKLTVKTYTVTTNVKDVETKYTVASGETADAIPEPGAGYVAPVYAEAENGEYYVNANGEYVKAEDGDVGTHNMTKASRHDEFTGWYTTATCECADTDSDGEINCECVVFDIEAAAITADITIYARFEESDHDYDNEELVTAPTYYAKGEKKTWCSCDAKLTAKTVEIAELTDTVKPTGTIHLGTQGSWSSTGTPAYETDGDPVSLSANAGTNVIITANDTGDIDALYNPSGIGKGIANIKAFAFPGKTALTADNYGAALQVAVTVFEDDTENLNNTANYVVKLGEVQVADLNEDGEAQYNEDGSVKSKSLENGEIYILYYYVTDKAGNRLDRLVRTAKFIYDNTAPAFTIEGANNASKVTGTPTYCKTATVTGIEDGATLTVNGVAVDYDATSGTYAITQAGNYLVTVTDKAGNKSSKKFQLNDDHSYDVKEVLSTCTEDGYKTEVCIVCNAEKQKVVYPHTGHIVTSVAYEATCTENGYILSECSQCDYSVKTEFEVDEDGEFELDDDGEKIPVFPALGHDYPTKEVPAETEGEDPTTEIVYTVVTEATCKTKGKETATCQACGETISREIDIDEDAHSWGSAKTLKATCTEAGYTYRNCKLCYESEKVTDIPATGHVETQWVETVAATCGEAGTETLQCKKCKAYVGDYEYTWCTDLTFDEAKYEKVLDEDGNCITSEDNGNTFYYCYNLDENGDRIFKYETREIAATGRHILAAYEVDDTFWVEEAEGSYKYILDEDGNKVTDTVDGVTCYQVYKTYAATADADGQITRYCTQCGHEWTETVTKIEKYTVKFVDEDGTTEIKTITDVVTGTTIEKTAVTEPTKANSEDGKYKYTFAGWKDEKGNSVTLPFDVTADITLKASYAQSTIIYTHQFKVPNTWVSPLSDDGYDVFATMTGAMGDKRVPSAEPTFKLADADSDAELKQLYTFEFLGWSTTGARGDITTDFTITGDTTYYAVFEAKAIAYQVIYYNGAEVVWATTVDGGETVTFGGTTPTKDYDGEYHYEFDTWYTDASLKTVYKGGAITALTRLYAGFTATKHTCKIDTSVGNVADDAEPEIKDGIVQNATCTLPENTQMICSCGYTKTVKTADALGHDRYKKDENGDYVLVDGEKVENTAIKEIDGAYYSVVSCSVCGQELSRTKTSVTVAFKNYNGVRLDTQTLKIGDDIVYGGKEPAKDADAKNTYTFAGWYVEGDTTETLVDFEGLTATADVVYVAKFTAIVRTFRVTYVGVNNETLQTEDGIAYGSELPEFTGTIPTKNYDNSYHYTFKEWSVAAGSEVTSDVVVQPVYNRIAHVYTDAGAVAATCTERGGTKKACECGRTYIAEGSVPALGHDFIQTGRVEPDYVNGVDGCIKYGCTRCEATDEKALSAALIEVKITVKDTNGAARSGAKVDLYNLGTGAVVGTQTTDGNGIATFYVAPGSYKAVVEDKETYISVDSDRNVEGGKVEVEPEVTTPDCSCNCHKTSFWGIMFRLFHKFIKLFTGKIGCCDCPDAKYNS